MHLWYASGVDVANVAEKSTNGVYIVALVSLSRGFVHVSVKVFSNCERMATPDRKGAKGSIKESSQEFRILFIIRTGRLCRPALRSAFYSRQSWFGAFFDPADDFVTFGRILDHENHRILASLNLSSARIHHRPKEG